MDRALSWDTIARIRDRWPRKLIIKGLLSVEDIARAAEIGADAVAVSNHGGRQLDWSIAPIDILPAAREAVCAALCATPAREKTSVQPVRPALWPPAAGCSASQVQQ